MEDSSKVQMKEKSSLYGATVGSATTDTLLESADAKRKTSPKPVAPGARSRNRLCDEAVGFPTFIDVGAVAFLPVLTACA